MIEIITTIIIYWLVINLAAIFGGIIDGLNRKLFVVCISLVVLFFLVITLISIPEFASGEATLDLWACLGSLIGGLTARVFYQQGYNLIKSVGKGDSPKRDIDG